MRLATVIIFILSAAVFCAQNYSKDWEALSRKLEKGMEVPLAELEGFAAKHKAQHGKYPDNSTQLYSLIGNAYSRLGEAGKAQEHYLRSFEFARQAQDTTLKYIVAYSLGVLSFNGNNLLEAEKYYLYCLPGMAVVYGQSSREYTVIFGEYVRLLVDMGKYSEASPYVDALLYYYKTLDGENNIKYVAAVNLKAIIAQNQGNYELAIQTFSDLIEHETLLKLGDTIAHIVQMSNLGDVYREAGIFEPAIASLTKARELFYSGGFDKRKDKLNERTVLASIENNLGLCYKNTSDPQQAEVSYNHALAVYREAGEENSEEYCTTLSNKANLYSDLGRYGEASGLLLDALHLRKKYYGEHTENYANALANLALVYYSARYFTEALDYYQQADVVYKEAVGELHQGYANNQNGLSLCYLYFKDYKKAESCKLKALEIIEKTVGKNHYRYASFLISSTGLYRETRQYQKAETGLLEALQLIEKNLGKKHELYARAQLELAGIYAVQQKFEAAGPLYFACLDYYSAQLNDYFNAMSSENQAQFLQSTEVVFDSYNIYLINYKLNAPKKDFSEHLKRALRYQLLLKSLLASRSAQVRREIANSRDAELKNIYQDWVNVKNELINSFKSTEHTEDNNALLLKASELEAQLKSRIKTFAKNEAASFETLRARLGEKEAAIEVFKAYDVINDSLAEARYGVMIIKKNSAAPELFIFKNGGQLQGTGFDYYTTCIDEQLPDTGSYATYFEPLAASLKNISRIYLSSDGIFHKISFAGLYNPKTKKYLADELDIVQTSNLGSVSAPAQTPAAGLIADLFGYPDYEYDFKKNSSLLPEKTVQQVAQRFGLSNLAPLPGTKVEVEEIAKALNAKNWKINTFTQQFASEKNLRLVKDPLVLHIATHGFYLKDIESDDKLFLGFESGTMRANSLLRSGIILAGAGPATQDSTNRDSENDGILTADEATLLNLNNTDLVVLSACQTGLGDEMGTEGVAGLQRSFTIAGARHIIMSLWPVDDKATQLLMTEFYKSYSLKQDVAAAFKQAQLAVRQKYKHPYFWAAFVLLKTFN